MITDSRYFDYILRDATYVRPVRLFYVTVVPTWLLRHEGLGHTDKLVLAILLGYGRFNPESNECQQPIFPSVKRLARDLGSSVRTVQRSLMRLEQRGVLARRYRDDDTPLYTPVIPKQNGPSKSHVWYPNWLLARADVGSRSKLVYGAIAQRVGSNGWANVSYARLAEDLAMDRRSVLAAVNDLRGRRLLDVTRRRHRPHLYFVRALPEMAPHFRRDTWPVHYDPDDRDDDGGKGNYVLLRAAESPEDKERAERAYQAWAGHL